MQWGLVKSEFLLVGILLHQQLFVEISSLQRVALRYVNRMYCHLSVSLGLVKWIHCALLVASVVFTVSGIGVCSAVILWCYSQWAGLVSHQLPWLPLGSSVTVH